MIDIQSLATRYKSGDNTAGWEMILSQQNLLKSLIGKANLGSNVDPEDVLSEMQITLMGDLKYYDPQLSSLSHYVTMVFWRSLSNILNRLTGGQNILPLHDVCVQPESEDRFDESELIGIVVDAMDKIPPLHKVVLTMFLKRHTRHEITAVANRMVDGLKPYTETSIRRLIDDSVNRVRAVISDEIQKSS